MPVINGVYLKDFTALPGAVADANIIPIAISGDNIAYRTTVAGIITDARITSKLLTGLSVTGGAVVSTDTILQAFGKVQNQLNSKVSSVGLSMPSAFTVTNSPVTGSGTLTVTGAGLASQYIRGDGQLADFPTGGGGGSSVSYYLNGSVNQGTFVGNTYYEMNKTPVLGAGTDFTIAADGYIAQFITDANDPNSLLIPAGNWNFETYFSASSGGGTPSFYVELSKWNGSSFTAIANSSATPELIAFGTTIAPYFSSLAVPETVLLATDRLAIRIYVVNSGRTITLHTEDNHLCQIITTFTTGLQSLNGISKQTQFFAVGTSGNDFNISSATDTHTFNIPNADSSARGLVSTGTQSFAGVKTFLNNIKSNDQFYIREQNALNLLANYTQVQANNTYFAFTNGAGTGSATFTYNGSHTYTLPGATGTIALVGGAGVGTVTSVAALTLGTSGTDLSSTVANGNTTPVITLNVPTASASNRGALSSADWTTFNGKQNTITLTTTGTSGAATFISNTLNIPDYGGALSGYLPLTGGTLSTSNITETLRITNSGTGYALYVQSNSYFQGDVTFQSGFKSPTNTFTLPAATGTIALTSDLSAYLPLAGGTLTGALNGTSASFSGAIATTNTSVATVFGASGATTNPKYVRITNTSGDFFAGVESSAGNQIIIGAAGYSGAIAAANGLNFSGNAGTNNHLSIASGGAATFSSTASATAFIPSGASVPTNGMYSSAANTLNFATNSLLRLTISPGGGSTFVGGVAAPSFTVSGATIPVNGMYRSAANTLDFATNSVNRLSISSGGDVLVGMTSATSTSITSVRSGLISGQTSGDSSAGLQAWNQATSGDNKFAEFYTEGGGGTLRGSIDYNRAAGLVRYNTTSDANLKNIIGDSNKQKSIDILNSTKIREFSWKEDETNKSQIGVIAQELYETYKGAVSVGSDSELLGTEDYKTWAVDKTAFTFHLIAGFQEHERIIQELKAEIDILKNK